MQTVNYLSSKASCGAIGSVFDLSRGRFPAVVRVETTNACNARCKICPHSELKRPIRRMDDELFTQIIDECARYGCKETHLHNFGEPLLDKQLEDRVRYAKQKGLDKVKIFSNGSLLDEDRARGLIEAGLDEIKISFDGADREEFEQIRAPLKFDEVVDNIKRLVTLRDRARSKMRIRVACCSTSDKQGTMQSLEGIVDGFSFGKIHNWGGESFTNGRGKVRKPCSRLWRTFTILADGDVALCCLDYDAQFTLGHLDADTTIRDVWTGTAYREVRARHKAARQAEIHLCNRCTKSFLRP